MEGFKGGHLLHAQGRAESRRVVAENIYALETVLGTRLLKRLHNQARDAEGTRAQSDQGSV